jgi:hypothetical protein
MIRYQIDVPDDMWDKFKKTLPPHTSINTVINQMIKERVEADAR